MKLGQSSTTLSGGEAQRVKLATSCPGAPRAGPFYILDEPTTGLHIDDVTSSWRFCSGWWTGNTVLVIEHNLDVIKCRRLSSTSARRAAGGGGTRRRRGTPEEVAEAPGKLYRPIP